MGEIRISIPSETLGFSYPVCKKLSAYVHPFFIFQGGTILTNIRVITFLIYNRYK